MAKWITRVCLVGLHNPTDLSKHSWNSANFCNLRCSAITGAKGNANMTEARHFQRIWSSDPLRRLRLFSNGFWYMYPARSYRGPAGFSMASSSCWARTCRCTGEDFCQSGFHWMFCCILHDFFRIIQSVSWTWLIRRIVLARPAWVNDVRMERLRVGCMKRQLALKWTSPLSLQK